MKIKRKIMLAFTGGVILLSFFLLSKFITTNNVIVLDEENKLKAFSTRILGINVSGFELGANLLNVKMLKVGVSELGYPVLFKSPKADYILFIGKNDITLYSKQGKLSAEFKVKDSNIIQYCVSDIDNDGNDEIILLKSGKDSEYADDMVIAACKEVSGEISISESYSLDCRALKPWKVQTADTDGDGKKEISLGVYKTAAFHPVMAKRPFLYNWEGNGISPRWLGSRLSRPFDDYIFADLDGDNCDELIAIELLENGRKLIASYKWKGFGFEKSAESIDFKDVLNIRKGKSVKGKGCEICADVIEKKDLTQRAFIFNNDKLSLYKLQ